MSGEWVYRNQIYCCGSPQLWKSYQGVAELKRLRTAALYYINLGKNDVVSSQTLTMTHLSVHPPNLNQRRRPIGGLGETVPPKFEVGGRPMHPSPNILRSSVVGCARKYEQSKKRCR